VLSACATGLPRVDAGDLPRLQQEAAASPGNTGLQVQLGMAQFKAGEHEAARTTLEAAIEAGDESGPAFLYLGMANEELEDWSAARESYTRYLDLGESTEAVGEVRDRLTLIGRNLLRAQSRQALAMETEITATAATTPRSVAVLPLAFNSENQDLEPLVYALSDMMVTDFKISNALIVLERAQIQSLLDEMALTSAGYAEAGTGARAGRLLRAEHVFQGVLTSLGQNEIRTDADVLNVPSAASAGQITESAQLEQLFEMEKAIVIRTIREVLGVELTPAEEQAILENRWSNVLAFLAFGRGLREMDRGNYGAAQAEFQQATQLEPGSYASLDNAMSENAALLGAAATTTGDVAGVADNTGETGGGLFGPPSGGLNDGGAAGISPQQPIGAGSGGGTSAGSSLGPTLSNISEGVNPTASNNLLGQGSATLGRTQSTQPQQTNRDPVPESGDQDTVGSAGTQIRIVIRRPGGEQ
jgi:tetratricopeptide (TPR) repeat protein